MSGETTNKPSGSSQSASQSPASSPNHHAQRKSTTGAPGSIYNVGMNNTNGLKPLNPGWQVWNAGAQPSKRNASISSAASAAELSSSQGDASYRNNLNEGWTTSGPNNGTWDDVNDATQKKDLAQVDPHAQINLHHARQRQATVTQAALSAPRMDDRSAGSKNGQFSPQRYDNTLGKDTNRYPSSTSPSRPFGSGPFPGQNGIQGVTPNYDNLQTPSNLVNEDLSLALRGMAVEDDYSAQGKVPPQNGVPPSHPSSRAPPIPVPRGPYSGYPQGEYSGYYSMLGGRDSYADYSYGYEPYRSSSDPSMYSSPVNNASPSGLFPGVSSQTLHHGSSITEMHRQQGVYFNFAGDFSAGARPPGSPYYYAGHQAALYSQPSHSPMLTPQLPHNAPATLGDKKREMQFNIQQQISPQSLLYNALRSTPSPHPQAFGTPFDYGQMVLSGAPLYGPGPQGAPMFSQGSRATRREGEGHSTLRSPLLDEFRANKTRKWELRDIFGYIVEFSGDQHGSRFIQQKLETATSDEKQIIFDEIVPNSALQLIQDVFGNYVIQKLFEHGTQVQKTQLANTMEGHVLPLSLQMYGCRVVQKAIEYILPDQQAAYVRELDAHVLKCVKDANGNHVIQKLIERVSPDRLGFVVSFRGNVYDLSTHPYGCRVLQRCLEHLPDDQTRPLLDELHKYTINLMQDQYGNYVIQFVIEHGRPQDRALIISKLHGQMLQMARHKFASNVCEKALVCADAATRRQLIDEIMTPKQDGVSTINTMMKDQYANYVLQRALNVVEPEQKDALFGKVRPQLVTMRRYTSSFSKHLIAIERILEKYPLPGEASSEAIQS